MGAARNWRVGPAGGARRGILLPERGSGADGGREVAGGVDGVAGKLPLAGSADFSQIWRRDSRDTVVNVLGFLPVGVLAWLAGGAFGLAVRWLGVLGSGLLLSLAIETGQIWLPERVSSLIDLACNGLGALLGGLAVALASWVFGRKH